MWNPQDELAAEMGIEREIQKAVAARDHAALRRICDAWPREAGIARSASGNTWILYDSLLAHDPVLTRILLKGGADPDQCWLHKSFADITPLMIAAARGDSESVKALLEFKADAKRQDKNGDTALHHLAKKGNMTKEDALGMAQALTGAGCGINAANKDLQTPLHLAAALSEQPLVEFLLENGARRDIRNCRGETARDVAEREARRDRSYALAVFDRAARRIDRAAVKATAEPLRSAPKIALHKTKQRAAP